MARALLLFLHLYTFELLIVVVVFVPLAAVRRCTSGSCLLLRGICLYLWQLEEAVFVLLAAACHFRMCVYLWQLAAVAWVVFLPLAALGRSRGYVRTFGSGGRCGKCVHNTDSFAVQGVVLVSLGSC